MGWFKLAKTGTYKDKHGKVYSITHDILKKVVDRYDPTQRKAALTIGHPTSDKDPAYGFVDALKLVGDELFFKPGKAVAAFAKAVNDGMFPHVSAGFEKGPDWGLNHIAFIGAVPPAIPGLGKIEGLEFAAATGEEVQLEFADQVAEWNGGKVEFSAPGDWWFIRQIHNVGRMLRALRDKEIERSGVEAADALYPAYLVDDLNSDPPPDPVVSTDVTPHFSQPSPTEVHSMEFEKLYNEEKAKTAALTSEIDSVKAQNAEFATKITNLETEKTALSGQIADLDKQKRLAGYAEFCETLINEGRVLPAEKDGIVQTLEVLTGPGMVEFSSSTGEKTSKSRVDIYKESLSKRPKLVEFSHIATSGHGVTDESPDAIAMKARQYKDEQEKAGNIISFSAAVDHIVSATR